MSDTYYSIKSNSAVYVNDVMVKVTVIKNIDTDSDYQEDDYDVLRDDNGYYISINNINWYFPY